MSFLSWFKKPKAVQTELSMAIDRLSSMQLDIMSSVYSSDMSFIKLDTYCATIEDYNKLLAWLIEVLKYDTVLYPIQVPGVIMNIYIRDFYLDKEKNFVNPISSSTDFVNLCIDFLKLYEQTEQRSNKLFVTEKNLLITERIISNIISISSVIQEILYTQAQVI